MAVVNKKGSPGASVFCCHLVFFFFSPSTPHHSSVVEFGMQTVVRSAIHIDLRICRLGPSFARPAPSSHLLDAASLAL
jgi:hypothetical protein